MRTLYWDCEMGAAGDMLHKKLEHLKEYLLDLGSVAVAFSSHRGGG